MKAVHEEERLVPRYLEENVERNKFSVAKGDDVIGRLTFITLEKGDTLPDIARHFSLGLNGVSAANPGVDIWAPKAGERIMLPLSFILPDAPRKGIVINLAAMRLFQFKANACGAQGEPSDLACAGLNCQGSSGKGRCPARSRFAGTSKSTGRIRAIFK